MKGKQTSNRKVVLQLVMAKECIEKLRQFYLANIRSAQHLKTSPAKALVEFNDQGVLAIAIHGTLVDS
jgi:hypothetical protein